MDENNNRPDTCPPEIEGLAARTTAFEGQPEKRHCRRCGGPIGGRRRNGYCSDRCRMADRREQERRRGLELLDSINTALTELRRKVLP
jgi:predicted nucleic acid-binding Zn ribbon protein